LALQIAAGCGRKRNPGATRTNFPPSSAVTSSFRRQIIQKPNDYETEQSVADHEARELPTIVTADAGYFSEADLTAAAVTASTVTCRRTGTRMGAPRR
jgi:hypothetical protein